MSTPAGDLVANGRVAKFLVDLRQPASPEVYFVNGNFTRDGEVPDEAKFHFMFAQAVLNIPERLEEFNRVTYFSPTKRYAAGVLHTYLLEGSTEPVYGLQFYPQDVIAEQLVRRRGHGGRREDHHSGRQVRLCGDRNAADRLDGAGSVRCQPGSR